VIARAAAGLVACVVALAARPALAQLDRVEAAWAELVFARPGFDEAVVLAEEYHVLPTLPARAWAQAAAGLFRTLDPPLELVPRSFLLAERADAAHADGWAGKVLELPVCGTRTLDAVLLHREKGGPPASSAAELRALREKRKELTRRLHAAWDRSPLDRAAFDCLARHAEATLDAQPVSADAPPPLPAGATPTNADPRVARKSRMWRVATGQFLQGLDAHGSVMPSALFNALEKESSQSENVDVGMTLGKQGDVVSVVRVERGGPAAKAGLRKGWTVLRIDGKEFGGLEPQAINALLEGRAGSKVAIDARATATAKPKKLTLKRAAFVRSTVTGYAVGEGTALGAIRLGSFASGSAPGVRGALLDVQLETGQLPTALVLDLRGNGGGWVREGVAVADVFLGDGVVATQHNKRPPPKVFSAKTAKDDLLQPLVVLVDGECRSACEMVSSALQDHDRAVVLGQRTYGKGSVQAVIDATVGAWAVLLTIATYRGPRGRSLQSLGVDPDHELPNPPGMVATGSREADLPTALHADTRVAPHRSALATQAVHDCVAGRAKAAASWRVALTKADPWLLAAADWAVCLRETR